MQRSDVTFPSGAEHCAAWLYAPEAEGPHPLVVLAHGWAGTRDARLDAFAEHFVAAGLGALVFDYRCFGDSPGQPRQDLDIGRQREDYVAAIAYARGLDWVDPERVALWGSSFSGGHVLAVAAADRRIAAVVSQAPFIDGLYNLRFLGPMHSLRVTGVALRDEFARLRGRPRVMLPAVGEPGALALMTSADAEPGYRSIIPQGSPWRNETTARVALFVGLERLVKKAASLECPLLICVCEDDLTTPPVPAIRAAEAARLGELKRYAGHRHFDIYLPPLFDIAVADQTAFLTRVLLGA